MSVALLMGSDSDFPRLEECVATLKEFGVDVTARVLSAHRTPDDVVQFVEKDGPESGVKVFLCAAGGAAHLAALDAGDGTGAARTRGGADERAEGGAREHRRLHRSLCRYRSK